MIRSLVKTSIEEFRRRSTSKTRKSIDGPGAKSAAKIEKAPQSVLKELPVQLSPSVRETKKALELTSVVTSTYVRDVVKDVLKDMKAPKSGEQQLAPFTEPFTGANPH